MKVTVKNEPQFKGFVGCWAIVTEVDEFWGDVKMWNGTAIGIHPRNRVSEKMVRIKNERGE